MDSRTVQRMSSIGNQIMHNEVLSHIFDAASTDQEKEAPVKPKKKNRLFAIQSNLVE